MPAYYLDEAMFSLPEWGFVDRTIHRLASPTPGGEPITITVRRSPIEPSATLRALVDEEVATSAAEVTSFVVVAEEDATLAGAPALLLRTRWRTEEEVHVQAQAHVALEGTWLALSVAAPLAEREACEAAFERVLATFRWRSG